MLRYLPLVTRNALRNRRRTAFSILSIAASFCLLGVLMAMYHLFFVGEPSQDEALRLIVRNRIGIADDMPIAYRERIRQVKGVREISVSQYFGGIYKDSRDTKNYFARFAVDPDTFFTVSPQYHLPEDQKRAFQRERTACVVGRRLADRLNFHLGDQIVLVGDIWPMTLDLTVRGIYDSSHDDEHLFFSYEYFHESFKRWNLAGMFVLIADNPESIPRIIETVDNMFANSPAETKTETEKAFQLGFLSYLGDVKMLLLSICGALTFTVLLVSANTMAMSVRERVREVGVLKTLGFTSAAVLFILLSESVLIALVGGAIGLGLSAGIVSVLRHTSVMFVDLKPLSIPPWVIGAAVFLAVLVGLASASLPAWNASRRPIVACLRFTD